MIGEAKQNRRLSKAMTGMYSCHKIDVESHMNRPCQGARCDVCQCSEDRSTIPLARSDQGRYVQHVAKTYQEEIHFIVYKYPSQGDPTL